MLRSDELAKKAAMYRRMAAGAADPSAREAFLEWAERFEIVAGALSNLPRKLQPEGDAVAG